MTEHAASSLRDLVFTTETVPVIDELAALNALLPELPDALEGHAALLERLPPLLDLRGRALAHTQQYERFLTLAEADPSALEYMVDIGNALALLAHAGGIAMLLADNHARLVIGARIPHGMEEAARRFSGSVPPRPGDSDGTAPEVHHLEDGLALEAWFNDPPDLVTLLDEARTLFAAIETWSHAEPPSLSWYGARRGALILAYAKLCQIGLWPARSSDDLLVKLEVEGLASGRRDDPDPMRALVEIALGVGRRIARQGGRFVTVLGGVEL
ncbi:hypothetical protein [Bosea sp. (in: a-proteobacteria)]|uniref:hypothetical protein n=1 Tax=Bosea sp. (in: a-proteobacteria) TaxID=1871050 RepID=UPI001AC5DFAA|nr:hypothetical protein [Bosea sp. (in: a-proteobacteria)]MBN9435781.1 hypothetical protein [Bosea sp. (in: a-proteobacteria)]